FFKMDLQKLKQHIRVDHSFEDNLLREYMEWAEAEIKDSVSTSDTINEIYFSDNPHYERAVVLLTAHFFENRLAMTESNFNNFPYGFLSAVHRLRGGYHEGDYGDTHVTPRSVYIIKMNWHR